MKFKKNIMYIGNSIVLFTISMLAITSVPAKAVAQQKTHKRPNIIYIMTDDQSAVVPRDFDKRIMFDDVNGVQSHPFGFNGDEEVHTPIIDELAKQGMIFTRAYVSSPVCAPSRYSMMTGRYASRSKAQRFMTLHPPGTMTRTENNTELEADMENLPRLLQKAGYKTGFVGKSHLIHHKVLHENLEPYRPTWEKNGLMYYEKNADPNNPDVSKAMAHNHNWWAERIKEYGFDYADAVYAANLRELFNDSIYVHNVEWKNKAALEFIDQSADEPFFLYYSETLPHRPGPWLKEDGKLVYSLDANPKFTGEGYVDEDYKYLPTREEIKKEVQELGKDDRHAWLRWFDHAVGALVKKLKEKGIYENTLIVLTSDHGNYNLGKTTLYESGVRVPLMMHWPNGIEPNSEYDELVQNIDFTPTFLELAGVNLQNVEAKIDGTSLTSVLEGSEEPVHDYLFFEIGYARGVTTKDWKYITVRYPEQEQKRIASGEPYRGWKGHTHKLPYYTRNSHLGYHAVLLNPLYFDRDQLLDLQNDPREQYNVFDKHPEKANELRKLLVKSLKTFPDRPYGELTNGM